jgi:hypothetical protein
LWCARRFCRVIFHVINTTQKHEILVGAAAKNRRNVYFQVAEFLRDQGVNEEDLPLVALRTLRDLFLTSDDVSDQSIAYHALTEANFDQGYYLFMQVCIVIIFSCFRQLSQEARAGLNIAN